MYKFPMLEYSRGTVNVSAEYTAADAGILPQSEIAMTATAHRQTDNSKTAAATRSPAPNRTIPFFQSR